jgi:hypothetical protein
MLVTRMFNRHKHWAIPWADSAAARTAAFQEHEHPSRRISDGDHRFFITFRFRPFTVWGPDVTPRQPVSPDGDARMSD